MSDANDTTPQGIIDPDPDGDVDINITRMPDEDAPNSDPDDVSSRLDDTHPATDTNVDPTEQYHEGLSEAAEAEEPNS